MTVAASFVSTLVDEWVRAGLTDAVVCPGSRSTPLALGLARENRMALHVRIDERSAAFFALGIGLATRRPAVLVTTSGTAAAEVHAAVIEADLSRVPMIVCTADRPFELHDVGAPQTIEQQGLFGRSVRWAVSPGVPDEIGQGTWRSLASRLVAEAMAGPLGPGPVHANLAFREPLCEAASEPVPGRTNGRPWHRVGRSSRTLDPGTLGMLGGLVRPSAKGVIIAGAGSGRPENLRRLATALGWPVIADPRSGARVPGGPDAPTIASADALLRAEGFANTHVPEIVLRLGESWASKALAGWLRATSANGSVQVLVDPDWAWRDPDHDAEVVVPADADEVIDALVARMPERGDPDRLAWAQQWADAEASAQQAIERVLARHAEATEPGVARSLFAWSPPGSTLVVSSSMPARDLEWFASARSDPPRVLSNRGANGIDGVASTTLGVAAASAGTGGPVIGLLGDLAFLYDSTALVHGRREPSLPAVLVVIDNGGGGIFSFLPQASEMDEALFERLFVTPQRIDIANVARAAGCDTLEVSSQREIPAQLDSALWHAERKGPAVVVVRTDRKANLAIHCELEAEVADAVS